MITASAAIAQMRALLGTREQPPGSNHAPPVTTWYGLAAAWCAMTVSYALSHAGWAFRVAWCPSIVAMAKAGTQGLSWHTSDPLPGDLVVYSFRGQRPDHVGMVEQINSDATMFVLEGNTSDQCLRHRRPLSLGSILGFARPPYAAEAPVVDTEPASWPAYPGGTFRLGSVAPFVRSIQHLSNAMGCDAGRVDGVFGKRTKAAVKCVQRKVGGLRVDGEWGPRTEARVAGVLAALAGR